MFRSTVYKMSSFFGRRQTATRSGRSSPNLLSPNASKLQPPKTSVNSLYHLDVVDAASVIIPSVLTYSAPQAPNQSMSPMSTSNHPSAPTRSQAVPPPRSKTVPPPTPTSISFPKMNPGPSSAGQSVPQRPKRAPTPPPPYVENFPSHDEADTPATPTVCRSRSRTPSASSWIKRVVSRSSSRASLRKQYEPIPMSEEERIEAEEVKARKTKEALDEWNRINDALKAAGF
ncbi:hypothetical protein Pst134EA_007799 [Puccinia striiformis f. sp. tritici]|uniref:hypothetical protein n=1 Tax=Puccinia striiformis f. sp. tritici TaxID=168172 RepID=UPI00200810A6|nr:hypothetical protein Pst134EA_007799 [Puccinia striiformis f. sp. tritici]KAH9470550.1 hypothetical protein Pst134EA_007799 [Puccinia striiformis f. sp. tritici]